MQVFPLFICSGVIRRTRWGRSMPPVIAQGVTLPDLQRRYTPGMRLPVGSVRVSVARDRYEPANREVMIRPGNNAIVFNLQRIRQ